MLSEYSDDELIEEVKHRGLKIEIKWVSDYPRPPKQAVIIGGVTFDVRT